jgi:hypothetical protein
MPNLNQVLTHRICRLTASHETVEGDDATFCGRWLSANIRYKKLHYLQHEEEALSTVEELVLVSVGLPILTVEALPLRWAMMMAHYSQWEQRSERSMALL